MATALRAADIESQYEAAKGSLHALVIERARRIVEEPDLYFAPEQRDRELIWQIWARWREFAALHAQYLSTRGEYLMLGCLIGEHKKCRREIVRAGARLVCGCACHRSKEVA